MLAHIPLNVFNWTFKGILFTCRFLWISPFNAIKFLPRRHATEDASRQMETLVASESKVTPAIPGSPGTTELHQRLTEVEKEMLSLKRRLTCDRASWERRFAGLQTRQEDLRNQLSSRTGVLVNKVNCDDQGETGEDNREEFEDFKNGLSRMMDQQRRSEISSRDGPSAGCLSDCQLPSSSTMSSRSASSLSSDTSLRSWRTSKGPHRVFVPNSPMDLEVGHRVRTALPS